MKHSLFTLLSICCISFASGQEKVIQQIHAEVERHTEAYTQLADITSSIGHRLTGSENGRLAEQYVYNLLRSYGCEVRFQEFEVESWKRISLNLSIAGKPIESVALAHSPVQADVQAELIDMGNGTETDYTQDIAGKIAVVYLGVLPNSKAGTPYLHRSEKTKIALDHGASGVIFINTVKDNVLLTGTASVTGSLIAAPAICIGLEDGLALKEQLKTTAVFAHIQMENFSGLIKARNVIATFQGKGLPQEKIVVGGHLDSWDLATGAIDNGIGSFALIDMARAFKKLKLKPLRTVEFVLFMGEEQGLLGSKAYLKAAEATDEIKQIRFMLNYDMTNAPTGFSTTRKEMEPLLTHWGTLFQKYQPFFKNANSYGAGLHSDHQPFMLAGIPTGGAAGGKLPNSAGLYYHSDGDNFNLVDRDGLKYTVENGLVLTYLLANEKNLPVQRFTSEEIKTFLEQANLKEPLTISGEWIWN